MDRVVLSILYWQYRLHKLAQHWNRPHKNLQEASKKTLKGYFLLEFSSILYVRLKGVYDSDLTSFQRSAPKINISWEKQKSDNLYRYFQLWICKQRWPETLLYAHQPKHLSLDARVLMEYVSIKTTESSVMICTSSLCLAWSKVLK